MQESRSDMRRIRAMEMAKNRRDSVFSCTNRAMKSDITLTIEKDHYTAGDLIKGTVKVWLTQEVKVKDLLVKISGHARVCWNEQRSYTKGSMSTVSRKNTETYLDHVIVLLKKDKIPPAAVYGRRKGSSIRPVSGTSNPDALSYPHNSLSGSLDGDDGIFVAAGEHIFHFDFTLPRNLPSSYTGRWGQVRYSVKTILERPWKFDIVREKEFTVAACLDLNEEPELLRPVSALGEFRSGVLCFRGGLINLEVRLSRRGYIGGEDVPFQVVIENNTGRKLQEAKVSLVQHIVFKAGQKTRKISHVLSTLTKGEISAWKTDTWEDDVLTIPDDVLPSTEKHVNTIQIKYTFTLSITYSTWRDEYNFPVAIFIGTQSFRKPLIHSYLSVLGYSTSPSTSPVSSPQAAAHYKHDGKARCRSASKPSIPASLIALDQLRMRRASALPALLPTSLPARSHGVARMDSSESARSNPQSGSPTLGTHANNNNKLYKSQPIPQQSSWSSLPSRNKRRSSNETRPLDGEQRRGRDVTGDVTAGDAGPRQIGQRKWRSRGVSEPRGLCQSGESPIGSQDGGDSRDVIAEPAPLPIKEENPNILDAINE